LRFGDVLKAANGSSVAGQAPAPYTVQRGDTLSHVCEKTLKQQGASPSRSEVYAAVRAVAEANGLRNPDLILVGQELDLSALQAGAGGRAPAATVSSAATTMPAGQKQQIQDAPLSPSQAIAQLLARIREVNKAESAPKTALAAGGAAWAPIMDAPARITSGYGMRRDPFTGRLEHHHGVDLAAAAGTPVHAPSPGEVTFSGWQRGYGRVVIIQHEEGVQTVYAHNAKNLVKVGDRVGSRTPVARVGSSGRSTGPHLHFEVRRNGRAVDPTPYLSRNRVQIAQAS